ncbi:hypothetical protein AVEN_26355-1 [Araneus ventricosus]|uniref:Uncharacterized protein n=1 Tax=Araneus ventricosus TaxID=182803 RepID=A0A4Y2SAV9_ARAVE|nr:hypothetical protein AVEN_26355-1 [Araneus ventricosus]
MKNDSRRPFTLHRWVARRPPVEITFKKTFFLHPPPFNSDGSFILERILKRNDRTRVRLKGTNTLKGTNRSSLRTRTPRSDSNTPYGSGLPVRILPRTPCTDLDSLFRYGLLVPE